MFWITYYHLIFILFDFRWIYLLQYCLQSKDSSQKLWEEKQYHIIKTLAPLYHLWHFSWACLPRPLEQANFCWKDRFDSYQMTLRLMECYQSLFYVYVFLMLCLDAESYALKVQSLLITGYKVSMKVPTYLIQKKYPL